MKHILTSASWHKYVAAGIILLYLALASGSSLTNRPQIDEGMFASPALNLAEHGRLATDVLESDKSALTRINERTYWVMPLFLLNVAASFAIFDFSLFSMRLVSIFWGIVLLAAWYIIVLKFSQNRNVALFCTAIIGLDYVILDTASSGRMDMMCAALGFTGVSVFLLLRERHLLFATLFSQTCVVLSGMTHPNGIYYFFDLIFLTVYFDFRRVGAKHLATALIPYMLAASAFGIWVLQDTAAFKDQFIDNAMMSGRTSGFSSPLNGIIREFTERYPQAFGLGGNSSGHSGPIYLKGLILLGYFVGLIGFLSDRTLRRNHNYFPLLVLAAIHFLLMSLMDGQKLTQYLVHIVPFYCAFLAIWLGSRLRSGFAYSSILIAGVTMFLALQAGGMAMRIRQNTYGNFYNPAIDFLKQNATADDIIMGGSELGFGLRFPRNHIDDGRFGFYSGKRPTFIAYDSAVEKSWQESKQFFPEFYEYFPRLLKEEYEVKFENSAYKIYKRKIE